MLSLVTSNAKVETVERYKHLIPNLTKTHTHTHTYAQHDAQAKKYHVVISGNTSAVTVSIFGFAVGFGRFFFIKTAVPVRFL